MPQAEWNRILRLLLLGFITMMLIRCPTCFINPCSLTARNALIDPLRAPVLRLINRRVIQPLRVRLVSIFDVTGHVTWYLGLRASCFGELIRCWWSIIIFVAVSLANLRMLLMVVSAADMMDLEYHRLSMEADFLDAFSVHYILDKFGYGAAKYPSHLLLAYYQGFTLTIFFFGIMGTVLDIGRFAGAEILRIVIFVTPIYILLNIINARQNRLAVLGSILSPLLFPFAGEWAILLQV